jgi:hypothetical protein
MREQRRRVRLLGRALALLLGSILGFFLAEAICRWKQIPYRPEWTPSETALARFDPELGWSYVPDRTVHQRFDGRLVPFHFNSDGIRVPTPGLTYDPSKPTVLFIGCSFTMGHGLPYEETVVGRFAALPRMPYQAVNLGVQAYGSDQALITLRKFLPRFDTKLVVYTFLPVHIARNGNYDRRTWFPTGRFIGTKPLLGLDADDRLVSRKKPKLYEDYLQSWFYDLVKIEVGKRTKRLPSYPTELTRRIIREMKEYTEGHGARFVLLYWDWEFYDLKNEVQKTVPVEEVFEGLGLDLIRVSAKAPVGWQRMRLSGSGHPDRVLSAHVASVLLEYLEDHHLLDG